MNDSTGADAVFLTGFPGFLGSQLVERLLQRYPPEVKLILLVQARYRALAQEYAQDCDGCEDRLELVNGDIAQPDLGLGEQYAALAARTFEIYHLAAVYDLGVSRQLAMAVNVDGTNHMLAFAKAVGVQLQRFQYVSTCYVSGRYPGVFEEGDLMKRQEFNNYYEQTKYLAEIEVQQALQDGLPVTIYRPAIVVGDSQSGATQKYDGIYYFIQWVLRQPPQAALMPVIGNPRRYEVNFVPRDFVVDAIAYLSAQQASLGKTYQLCDPDALLVDEVVSLVGEATGRKLLRVPLPKWLAKGSVEYLPPVRDFMRIEPAAMDYFVHPTHYTCDNALEDLKGSGIACPPLYSYIGNLVRFMQAHPEISSEAMV